MDIPSAHGAFINQCIMFIIPEHLHPTTVVKTWCMCPGRRTRATLSVPMVLDAQRFRNKVSKKRTIASNCPHEHIVKLISGKTAESSEEVPQEQQQDKIFGSHVWLENTTRYLYRHRQMDLSDSNLKRIEKLVLERNKLDKWPRVYQVRIFRGCS